MPRRRGTKAAMSKHSRRTVQSNPTLALLPSKIRYFDLLPTETLDQTVQYLAPLYFNPTMYYRRQNTLRSLCLVSKRFQAITRPFLYSVVMFDGRNKMEPLLRREEVGLFVRRLIVSASYDRSCDIWKVRLVLEKAVKLIALEREKDWWSQVEMGFVKNLKRLHLDEPTISGRASFDFPLLERLSLCNFEYSPGASSSYHLPALKHLSITNYRYVGPVESDQVDLVTRLYGQPISLTLDDEIIKALPTTLHRSPQSPSVMAHCSTSHVQHLESFTLVALRLFYDTFPGSPMNALIINSAVTFIENQVSTAANGSLEVIYLDSRVLSSRNPGTSPRLKLRTSRLVEVCGQHGIKLMFENRSKLPRGQINEGFVTRSERIWRKKEQL